MSSSSLCSYVRSPSRLVGRRLLSLGLTAVGAIALGASARAQSATAFCFGDGTSITPCPCVNLGAPGEGCQNSSGVGGLLSAAGLSCVTGGCGPDTLTLTASGLLPTTIAVLIQSSNLVSPEIVFGDGLRCITGPIFRLGVLQATVGTVVFPASGAPTISARSAFLGDVIPPGGTRHYQVYYRDHAVSWCPPELFNITNGQTIVWR